MPRTVGGYAGIFMAVALTGIVINAVGLQHERHPAPLFAPEAAAPAPASSPSASAPSASAPPAAASPPKTEAAAPPAAKASVAVPTPPGRKTDPIGDWLRGGTVPETAKTVLSVQRALVKLGYDLEADGHMGATTEQALHDFEKAHGLPVTSELSPRLIAKLNGAGR